MFEEALAAQRAVLLELKGYRQATEKTLEVVSETLNALRHQVETAVTAHKELADRFERTTRDITSSNVAVVTQNVEALREVQKLIAQMIGSKVLGAMQWLIGTAILSGLGYLWYHFVLGTQ